MHDPWIVVPLIVIAGSAWGALCYLIGYGHVLDQKHMAALWEHMEHHEKQHEADILASSESAVVEMTPALLAEKKRKGEMLADDDESQIVNTKTPQQLATEREIRKNKKLDAWMPGAKRG